MRSAHLALACLLLCHCGRTTPGNWSAGPSPAGPPSELCAGETPQALVNGILSAPSARARVHFIDPYESAYFRTSVPSFDYEIYVEWKVSEGAVPVAHPITLDLASLPRDWRVSVYLSCANGILCYPAPDEYNASHDKNDGLAGVLAVQRASLDSSLYEMSLCLVLQERGDQPHPLLHSLELYVPNTATD